MEEKVDLVDEGLEERARVQGIFGAAWGFFGMIGPMLGGGIEIPAIDGSRAKVQIPAGTQTGQQFRLKGKGMSVLRSTQRGDMYAEIVVETPVNLTKKQKELLEQFEAEGKDSATRAAMGSRMARRPYAHQAIAARLVAARPHAGLARQWFRSPDVLALLPMDQPRRDHGLALVWSVPDERAAALLALSDEAFEAELLLATAGAAGELRLQGARAAWPLSVGRAEPLYGPGWLLLGDAAHVVHPLAGQGLNLGLADVASIARVLAEREAWRSPGDERLLARHARARAGDTLAMRALTDGLLQLFSHPSPWAKELRNRGLGLVNHVPPLKRLLTRAAMGR